MKYILCMLLLLPFYGIAQKGKNKNIQKGLQFDVADFNQKMEVVEWLYSYDGVAWRTTDSVMVQDPKELERLGQEWFCFEDESRNWHALYGNLSGGRYELVFHYLLHPDGTLSRSYEQPDTAFLNGHARALFTAHQQLTGLKDSVNIRFNQFIRQHPDKTFSVWILPAFQPTSIAVYGGEFIYTIDPSGRKVLADHSYVQQQFRGFKVDQPREIWLNYSETQKPTLGATFFVWYYKDYFTKIFLETASSTSTLIKSDTGWSWVHAEKEAEPKKKRK